MLYEMLRSEQFSCLMFCLNSCRANKRSTYQIPMGSSLVIHLAHWSNLIWLRETDGCECRHCLPFHLLPDTVDFHAYDKHLLHHNNRFYLMLWLSLYSAQRTWRWLTPPTKENALLYKMPPLFKNALSNRFTPLSP
jgi:hypothetical protein